MGRGEESLPRSAAELEELASYYDENSTAEEMDDGQWVEPMVTTSLRLPQQLFDEIRLNAQRAGKRQTSYMRELLEGGLRGHSAGSAELNEIRDQLDRVLHAVEAGPRSAEQSR